MPPSVMETLGYMDFRYRWANATLADVSVFKRNMAENETP